ncbi:MAG: hypothetical protein HC828_11270 [Blastochloris sp.]|nr:hypothetical protein [Blastochloris sp.]
MISADALQQLLDKLAAIEAEVRHVRGELPALQDTMTTATSGRSHLKVNLGLINNPKSSMSHN